MSDRDFVPLTAACVRALNDKLYEKRKGAALEIERFGHCNFSKPVLKCFENLCNFYIHRSV